MTIEERTAWSTWIKRNKPHLYAIADAEAASGRDLAIVTRCFVEGGASLIQLRAKSLSDREFYHQAATCVAICRQAAAWCLINDRVDIAIAAQAHGVHLGQNDLPPEVARDLLGPHAIIGVSTHDATQFQNAMARPEVDYVALGPLFVTPRKRQYAIVGPAYARELITRNHARPVVVIGGINETNIEQAVATNADALALIGALYSGNDLSGRTAHLVQAIARATGFMCF